MLKILKPAAEKEVLFTFSRKEKSLLLRAFFLSAAFHMVLLILFQIAKPFNFEALPTLSPIAVEVDLGNSSVHVVHRESAKNFQVNSDTPPSPLPFPQDYRSLFSYDKEMIKLDPDFSQIEQIPYEPEIEEECSS